MALVTTARTKGTPEAAFWAASRVAPSVRTSGDTEEREQDGGGDDGQGGEQLDECDVHHTGPGSVDWVRKRASAGR